MYIKSDQIIRREIRKREQEYPPSTTRRERKRFAIVRLVKISRVTYARRALCKSHLRASRT